MAFEASENNLEKWYARQFRLTPGTRVGLSNHTERRLRSPDQIPVERWVLIQRRFRTLGKLTYPLQHCIPESTYSHTVRLVLCTRKIKLGGKDVMRIEAEWGF